MKQIPKLLGILCAFCLMITFLITSIEAVAYWTPGYYEQEYTKYQVTEAVQMEMDDLLKVTDEMMAYLRGDRPDLHVPTIVNGQPREFFNAREIAHMEDVRGLFLGGLALRRICLAIAAACILILAFRYRPQIRRLLPRALCAGTLLFFLLTAVLAAIISTNFTKYFVIFHKIFFNNDLWILDPSTDLLINIVPEPFFVDTAARIGLTFAAMTTALFLVCFLLIKWEKKILSLFLALILLSGSIPMKVQADTVWPSDLSIEADAGIVMDAATGTVLYGKNIHDTYAPASITKVLTALLVLEHCSMDELVSFSQSAVYNVESNSSSAGYDVGDEVSVENCLYALLLKSANEAANALAEHVSGSVEEFAVLMNKKAKELGCVDSHFSNPSGLNDENHYVSAYDMALITRAAFEKEEFATIVSTTYYKLPPSRHNPEGMGISPGNKMVKKNWPEYYRPDVLGGKTGYTSIALNTLVNGAKQGDTMLITVVLHSKGTQYEDTKRLLDFGFTNFQSIRIADYDKTFSSIGEDLKLGGITSSDNSILTLDADSRIILPNTADFSETTMSLDYAVPADAPDDAIACINYYLGEYHVGQAYLTLAKPNSLNGETLPQELIEVNPSILAIEETEDDSSAESQSQPDSSSPLSRIAHSEESKLDGLDGNDSSWQGFLPVSIRIPSIVWKLAALILLLGGSGSAAIFMFRKKKHQEENAALERRKRRAERLKDAGISEAEFDLMMQSRRQSKKK